MSAAGGDAPKRPTKSSANPKGSSSTKRGRPRVEPQDESAVERRRTQIRLAQRAYRERKETTIAALERRVTRLQQTVLDMNQALLCLNKQALESGATTFKPALGDALRRTTEHFAELTRSASAGEDDGPDIEDPTAVQARPVKKRRSEVNPEAAVQATMAEPAPPDPGSTELPGLDELQTSPNMMSPPDLMGYGVPYGPSGMLEPLGDPYPSHRTTHTGHSEPAWMTAYQPDPPPPLPPAPPHPQDDTSPQEQQQQPQQQPTSLPPLDIPRYTQTWTATIDPVPSLKLPRTCSHNETAFWRRLQRESYERALMLLTDPRAPPELLQAKMRYSLCFGNKRTIADAVRHILAKTSRDWPMGNWEWPLMHVGGSGLHFDAPTADTSAPPPGWRTERNYGPWSPTHMKVHTPVPTADFPWNVPRLVGMDTTFFDCHDVEMYLRTKGLYLNASSSVAEMEIDEPETSAANRTVISRAAAAAAAPVTATGTAGISAAVSASGAPDVGQQLVLSSPDSVSLDSASSPHTPATILSEATGLDVVSISSGPNGFAPSPVDFAFPRSDTTGKDVTATGGFAGLPIPALPPVSSAGSMGKRRVTINVDRLLDLLNCMAVCLGRSPGYRQEDVDSVLEMVLQEAWVK